MVINMKVLIVIFEFAAGASGVSLFFYRNYLFSKYAREGAKNPDAVFQVLVNNHGSISYITSEQSDYLRLLVFLSVFLLFLMFAIDFLRRRYLR